MSRRVTQTLARHLSVAILAGTTLAAAGGRSQAVTAAQTASPAQTADPAATARFLVLFHGVRIGTEVVSVTRAGGDFIISARGQIAPPIDLLTNKFEMIYSADWQPKHLQIEGASRNQTLFIATTFGLTTATNDVEQGTVRGSVSHDVTPRTVVLPASYIAAYEGLAARLPAFQIGATFPVYVAPEGEIKATLNKVTPRRIVSPSGTTDIREYTITLNRPGLPTQVQVSIDLRGRLAKVVFGEQGFAAIREDIGTVMSREEKIRNPGDTDVFIPAAGFSLAATVTMPKAGAARMPAVVLVGSQGHQDRDETRYGVSIFGQLAGKLADNGYMVVRFDKRGVGQSGGRPEHAGVTEYAEDVLGIVDWLKRRKDVDPKRIVLVSHGDGSAIVLTAAGRKSDVRGVVMIAASGQTGRETVLAQQQLALARLNAPPAEQEARVAMQRKVIDAVTTGKGWETIPPDLRRQADSEWFRTWLLFDPAVAIRKVDQPLLVLHGEIDREMPASNAARLEQFGQARKKADTRRVMVPRMNHILLIGQTGDPEEYDSLTDQTISPAAVDAIVAWLKDAIK